jgi:hypothetical protein
MGRRILPRDLELSEAQIIKFQNAKRAPERSGLKSGRSRNGAFIWSTPYREAAAGAKAGAPSVYLMARYEAGLSPDGWAHIRCTTRKDFGVSASTVWRGLNRLAGAGLVELRDRGPGRKLEFRLITTRPPGRSRGGWQR